MPLPTVRDVHAVDVPLTNYSQAVRQQRTNFVAERVFPAVSVPKQSDRYYIFTQADLFRTDARKRSAGAESPDVGYRLSTDTYYAAVWSVRQPIDEQTRSNADAVLNLDMGATERVTIDLLIRKELDWISTFFGASIWNADTTPSVTWDNAESTPIEDVRARAYVMAQNTSYMGNTFVLGPNTRKRLDDHVDLIDRIKYTQRGIVTEELLAAVFGVDRVFTLMASRNTAIEGGTASYSFLAGNHALLCYTPPAAGLMTPAAGLTFAWSGLLGGGALGQRITRFNKIWTRSEYIEAEIAFDHKVTSSALGEFFSSAVAS